MFMSIKSIVAGGVCAGLLFGAAALAEPKAQPATSEKAPATWAPPAEIAPKAAPPATDGAAAPSSAATPAPAAPPAKSKADKQKDCRAQADAKGLHGNERKQFRAECEKQ